MLFFVVRVNPRLHEYKYSSDALRAVALPLGPIGMRKTEVLIFIRFFSYKHFVLSTPFSIVQHIMCEYFAYCVVFF